jgi:hypothetical protein
MTGKEYTDALEILGLSINDAARFLRIRKDTSARVANGDDVLQWPRAALLRLMIARGIMPNEIEQMMGDFDQEDLE